MKGIDLFCASPASTAICVSFDKSSVVLQGGRAIDRHNPHLRDSRRSRRGLHNTPSSSYPSHSHSHSQPQPPTKSKPYPQNRNQKKTTRKSSAKATDLISPPGSSRYLLSDISFFDVYSDFDDPISSLVPAKPSRSLSLNPDDSSALKPSSSSSSLISSSSLALKASSLSTFSPPSPALKPSSLSTLSQPSPALKPSSSSWSCDQVGLPSSSSSTRSHDQVSLPPPSTSSHDHQVVVLRVSLHCKGCEGKVRKHISRMEGVTSFSIDFATKKVTVIGNVTPLGVLTSVSRVKNAQFWPSPSSPSPVASSY